MILRKLFTNLQKFMVFNAHTLILQSTHDFKIIVWWEVENYLIVSKKGSFRKNRYVRFIMPSLFFQPFLLLIKKGIFLKISQHLILELYLEFFRHKQRKFFEFNKCYSYISSLTKVELMYIFSLFNNLRIWEVSIIDHDIMFTFSNPNLKVPF